MEAWKLQLKTAGSVYGTFKKVLDDVQHASRESVKKAVYVKQVLMHEVVDGVGGANHRQLINMLSSLIADMDSVDDAITKNVKPFSGFNTDDENLKEIEELKKENEILKRKNALLTKKLKEQENINEERTAMIGTMNDVYQSNEILMEGLDELAAAVEEVNGNFMKRMEQLDRIEKRIMERRF